MSRKSEKSTSVAEPSSGTVAAAGWPSAVQPALPALVAALAMDPEFGEWPEDEKILPSKQGQAIADALMKATHIPLRNCRIAVLWVEKMAGRDRVTLGKASVATGPLHLLGKVDGVIKLNWTAWHGADDRQRVALVDHELMHFSRDLDSGKLVLVHHDVEEFGRIIETWGLWKNDLKSFGESVKRALQLDLWEQAPPPSADKVTALRVHE